MKFTKFSSFNSSSEQQESSLTNNQIQAKMETTQIQQKLPAQKISSKQFGIYATSILDMTIKDDPDTANIQQTDNNIIIKNQPNLQYFPSIMGCDNFEAIMAGNLASVQNQNCPSDFQSKIARFGGSTITNYKSMDYSPSHTDKMSDTNSLWSCNNAISGNFQKQNSESPIENLAKVDNIVNNKAMMVTALSEGKRYHKIDKTTTSYSPSIGDEYSRYERNEEIIDQFDGGKRTGDRDEGRVVLSADLGVEREGYGGDGEVLDGEMNSGEFSV